MNKLISNNGSTNSYDAIGNPTGDGTWTYTWEKGRQLKKMSKTGTTAEFKYNADGLRVQKKVTVSGTATTTNYTLHGKNIVHMTRGSTALHFWYDAQNRPAIVLYGSTRNAYVHNLQGDIVGIIDSTGTEVVKYTYDAWGKVLSTTGSLASTLGTIQPFRYRGYVYDVETGLYYLRSRYYNPEWGRFINADAQVIENMYTYCKNTPILFVDNNGYEPKLANDSVILRNGPSNKASVVFTIMNKGAECYVLFPVCDDDGVAIWYFIEYERKNGKRLNGYVRAEDIIDNKHMDFILPNLSFIDPMKVYSTRTTKDNAYEVYCIQYILYSYGYLKSLSDCDGQYGVKTTAAVLAFQQFYNDSIPDFDSDRCILEDGIWGPNTYKAMKDKWGIK